MGTGSSLVTSPSSFVSLLMWDGVACDGSGVGVVLDGQGGESLGMFWVT